MKSLLAMVLVGILYAGCAGVPSPAKDLLEQADMKLAEEDYDGASALYADFIDGYPNDPQTKRARAIRTVIGRLGSAQADLGRAKTDELPRTRRELSDRQGEIDQLRAEMAKLRADLERLRKIDLQDSRSGTKK